MHSISLNSTLVHTTPWGRGGGQRDRTTSVEDLWSTTLLAKMGTPGCWNFSPSRFPSAFQNMSICWVCLECFMMCMFHTTCPLNASQLLFLEPNQQNSDVVLSQKEVVRLYGLRGRMPTPNVTHSWRTAQGNFPPRGPACHHPVYARSYSTKCGQWGSLAKAVFFF